MNICLVTTEYPPGPMGGIGTYCVLLTQQLVKRGHEVTVLTKPAGGAPQHSRQERLHVYRLQARNRLDHRPVDQSPDPFATEMLHLRHYCGIFAREVAQQLPHLHRKHRFDVILSQDIEAPLWLAQEETFLFNRMEDVPVVIFIHSPHRDCNVHNSETLYERHEYHRFLYETHSIALADHLLFASEYMRADLQRTLGCDPARTSVIAYPIGAPPPMFPFEERAGSGGGRKRVVYAGRIELRKGVENLLRAFVPLAAEDPDLTLMLFGRDCAHPVLNGMVSDVLTRRLIPEALRDRIRFEGPVAREELWQKYGRATLGVVPSLWEPFGYVCQEMMATGLPVVATREGGMAEMIEHGRSGLLCDSTPSAIEAALRQALALPAPERRRMGEAAARRIRDYCDNDRVIERTVALFGELKARCAAHPFGARRLAVPANLPFGARRLADPHPKAGAPGGAPANVAVVIPCYNTGEYLDQSIASLFAQDRPPNQIVVVNDGSTAEPTLAALDSLRRMDRVRVLDFPNGGLPVARNRGAEEALRQGADALVFLDSDDELRPTYLRKAADVLGRHPEAGAVTAWTRTVGLMNTWWCPFHGQFPYLLADCMSTPPAMVRAAVYRETGGFSPDMRYAYEDWDFWISVCERGYAMLVIPEPLIVYRMREGSISRVYKAATREHGRRTMMARHPAIFREYGAEALLLAESFLYAARGGFSGSADLSTELRRCQDFIAYLGSLPGRPIEATRFVLGKVADRIARRLPAVCRARNLS